MKIIRKKPNSVDKPVVPLDVSDSQLSPWKVLIVDDEEDVLRLTLLNLKQFRFAGRELELLCARSAAEAKALLQREKGIAVALLDVVMESDLAGLELVEYIREELCDSMIRLYIRTGQPGMAPERYVIDHFDIDGYADKSELTAQRLYTLVRTALKAYQDLHVIEQNRIGLAYVLEASRDLYSMRAESLNIFFRGLLTQVISLLRIGESGLLATIEGVVLTIEGDSIEIRAGTGKYAEAQSQPERYQHLRQLTDMFSDALGRGEMIDGLPSGALLIPLTIDQSPIGYIYLEHTQHLTSSDRNLLRLLGHHSASALENLRLNVELNGSYDRLIDMLANVAEYKDVTTGDHVNRVADLCEQLALRLGLSADQACALGRASRLHDVGKIGVPDRILQKSDVLTEDEFEVVKRHTSIGADMLKNDPGLALSRDIALWHHERWDGAGYPDGLAGEAIPIEARIVAVIDVYDALVNLRPYKEAWSQERALEHIANERAGHFDPRVVDVFLAMVEEGRMVV